MAEAPAVPTASNYFTMLATRCEATRGSLCVGLDPDPKRLPRHLGNGPEAIFQFCAEIVEATAESAAAFKPNLAFFESIGIEGWNVLAQVIERVPKDIPVILDAKRGDIGSTARHYARAMFEQLGGHAVTVNPYMGLDSVEPFLSYEDRGVYVLCLTSNATTVDFQMPNDLYLRVARKVKEWNTRGNCGMVVGATKAQLLENVRLLAPEIPLLIPGLGAQGGDLDAILAAAPGLPRHHLLFNVSRSILYAGDDAGFARQARQAAQYYREMIETARDKAAAAKS